MRRTAGEALLCQAALIAGMLATSMASADDRATKRAKEIVNGTCFLCHGAYGEAASELFPRLAGQNAAYIAKQLANFKSGERRSSTMQPIATSPSSEDMEALGRYFSRQSAPPHDVGDAAAAERRRTVYRGGDAANRATSCIVCHGEKVHGTENLPRLAGQVASYIVLQLRNFGSRRRTNDNEVMHAVAASLTDSEMLDVAEYLSTLN